MVRCALHDGLVKPIPGQLQAPKLTDQDDAAIAKRLTSGYRKTPVGPAARFHHLN
jgi:hypothetical protein